METIEKKTLADIYPALEHEEIFITPKPHPRLPKDVYRYSIIVLLDNKNETYRIGVACCSPKDSFVRKVTKKMIEAKRIKLVNQITHNGRAMMSETDIEKVNNELTKFEIESGYYQAKQRALNTPQFQGAQNTRRELSFILKSLVIFSRYTPNDLFNLLYRPITVRSANEALIAKASQEAVLDWGKTFVHENKTIVNEKTDGTSQPIGS